VRVRRLAPGAAAARRAARPLAVASDMVWARATEAARHGLRAVLALVDRGEVAIKDAEGGSAGWQVRRAKGASDDADASPRGSTPPHPAGRMSARGRVGQRGVTAGPASAAPPEQGRGAGLGEDRWRRGSHGRTGRLATCRIGSRDGGGRARARAQLQPGTL
jgi:hypothetical protein